jgi:hypothetical protein
MEALSSFDGCGTGTHRRLMRLAGSPPVRWSLDLATVTPRHLGHVVVRPGGLLVCLGRALERHSNTSFRRLGRISGPECALGRLPTSVLRTWPFFSELRRATSGRLVALACLLGSVRRGLTRLPGGSCTSFQPVAGRQALDLDNLSDRHVNEGDKGST